MNLKYFLEYKNQQFRTKTVTLFYLFLKTYKINTGKFHRIWDYVDLLTDLLISYTERKSIMYTYTNMVYSSQTANPLFVSKLKPVTGL